MKTYGGPLGTIIFAVTAAIFIFSPTLTPKCRLLQTMQGVKRKKKVFRFTKCLRLMTFKVTTKMKVRKQKSRSSNVRTNCHLPHFHQNCRLLEVEGDHKFGGKLIVFSPEQKSHLNCLIKLFLSKSFPFFHH